MQSAITFIDDRIIQRERIVDNQVKIGLLIRHLDSGPNGYYLTHGHLILAGPKRREELIPFE